MGHVKKRAANATPKKLVSKGRTSSEFKKVSSSSSHKAIEVHESSGNVFADLGLPDAEERLAKSRLAQSIAGILSEKKLTQAKAAALLGIDQPKISKLIRGQLKDFSTDRLLHFLNALGQDVDIVIKPKTTLDKPAVIRVLAA